MADQTDFTQIAADFAASLQPAAPNDAGAMCADDLAPFEVDERSVSKAENASGKEASQAPGPLASTLGHEADAEPDNAPGQANASPLPSSDDADASTLERDTLPSEAGDADTKDDDIGDASDLRQRPKTEPTAPVVPVAGNDADIFSRFPAAPYQSGEFTLPLSDLVIGEHSAGVIYDFDSGAGESLLHAVQVPENIAPITVMKSGDEWHVTDGWARVNAMRLQFGNTANILVRVVEWDGTRNEALYRRFAAEFLSLKSRKVDKAMLLRQFHLAWEVPQQVLAARIGWTESRVTRELAAAQAFEEAPRFAELHIKAGDPPVDYLYRVQQARTAAAADDAAHPKRAPEKSAVAKMLGLLDNLLNKSERFPTAEALIKLGIAKPGKGTLPKQADMAVIASSDVIAPDVIDCVEDSGGEAVALIELGTDQLPSIRLLVDAASMDDRRKAEVRQLMHEALDRLLGI